MWQCALCEATSAGTMVKKATRDLCDYCVASLARSGRFWCAKGQHVVSEVGKKPQWCSACRSEANRAYRQKDPGYHVARVKAWKQSHPDRPRKRASAKWTPAQLERRRQWYADRRAERLEKARAYRAQRAAANPGYWKERRQRQKVNKWKGLFR